MYCSVTPRYLSEVAAQIVFLFTPNSAAAERVFSLLKLQFGHARDSALADMMQATLMLMYNERACGHAEWAPCLSIVFLEFQWNRMKYIRVSSKIAAEISFEIL